MQDPEFAAYLRADPQAAYALGLAPPQFAGAPRPALPQQPAAGSVWGRLGGMGGGARPAAQRSRRPLQRPPPA